MKVFVFVIFMSVASLNAYAAMDEKNELQSLKQYIIEQEMQLSSLEKENIKQEKNIDYLSAKQKMDANRIDSLKSEIAKLTAKDDDFEIGLTGAKKQIDDNAKASDEKIGDRTTAGIIIGSVLFVVALFVYLILYRRINNKTSSIESIKDVQDRLQNAQTLLQEESLKLDSKLIELIEKQLSVSIAAKADEKTTDHSLVVKLADEIARIETNLSKMDKSVKGYRQLVQAKDRMINNVRANGYEIISLLGQEYNDGMQFEARFVPDDSLPEGKRIITGMIKMQVNYNGKLIQPAQIVVSQNI